MSPIWPEELGVGQPLVSHHLKVLRQAGLIEADRYRYWTHYRLRPGALVRLAAGLLPISLSLTPGAQSRSTRLGQPSSSHAYRQRGRQSIMSESTRPT
jgi:hypothetical protein